MAGDNFVIEAGKEVVTTPYRSANEVRHWCTADETQHQHAIRHAGTGRILWFVPGSGGDLIVVQHADGNRGIYFYDEVADVPPRDERDS